MRKDKEIAVPENHIEALEKQVDALRTLLEMSSIISSTLDLNDLMNLVMEKAKQELEAEACSILFYNGETNKLEFEIAMCNEKDTSEILKKKITLDMGQGIAGWVAQNLEPLVIEDARADPRFYSEADKQTGFITKNIVAVPLVGRRGLIGVAELINPKRKDYDKEVFKTLCKQFALAIENALFHKESIEKEKIKQEMEFAAALQKSFLPLSPSLRKNHISVSAINIPASKIGGDLYDFIELQDNKLGILIGDVSGKGISGALYMSKIISDFRYTAHHIIRPEATLNKLNSMLMNAPMGMYLTAIYIVADTITGNARITAAGHPPFLLINSSGVKVMDILSGPPVGILPAEYPSTVIKLHKGDRLLMFTDGVFEAKNKEGERLGFQKIVDFVKSNPDGNELIPKIVSYVNEFSKNTERADDLTIIEITWTK
jgi:sigma-B regulation protein RsbU (phosphoserine phosphatase)